MKWELEQAEEALRAGETALASRYIEKALEQVRCMTCHGALDRPHHQYYKGFVHDDCAEKYSGRIDYMNKHGE